MSSRLQMERLNLGDALMFLFPMPLRSLKERDYVKPCSHWKHLIIGRKKTVIYIPTSKRNSAATCLRRSLQTFVQFYVTETLGCTRPLT